MGQVCDEDWEHLKAIHDRGHVQVSVHSFADGFDEGGSWYSHFVTHKGIEVLTESGVEFKYCIGPGDVTSFMQTHDSRETPYRIVPYSDEELERNYERLDAIWQARGITPGMTRNLHWRNIPSNALKFAKKRGQLFSMCATRCNYAHADREGFNWRQLPYGDQGMFMDYMPVPEDAASVEPTDFFHVRGHVSPRQAGDPLGDSVDFCRCRKPALPGLCTHSDLDLIAQSIIRHSKLGLQSLFFACPITHEMNLATLTVGEWREVLETVQKGLARYPRMPVLYDDISRGARAKCETHIRSIQCDGAGATLRLEGRALADVWLYVFEDEGEGCAQRFEKVSAFEGGSTIRIG